MRKFKISLTENQQQKCVRKGCPHLRHKRSKLCQEHSKLLWGPNPMNMKKQERDQILALRDAPDGIAWKVYRIEIHGFRHYGMTGDDIRDKIEEVISSAENNNYRGNYIYGFIRRNKPSVDWLMNYVTVLMTWDTSALAKQALRQTIQLAHRNFPGKICNPPR